jgi:hypothetical protein
VKAALRAGATALRRYLGLVISKLSAAPAEASHAHGAFRHSKLTMLLRNALLGNSKATRPLLCVWQGRCTGIARPLLAH